MVVEPAPACQIFSTNCPFHLWEESIGNWAKNLILWHLAIFGHPSLNGILLLNFTLRQEAADEEHWQGFAHPSREAAQNVCLVLSVNSTGSDVCLELSHAVTYPADLPPKKYLEVFQGWWQRGVVGLQLQVGLLHGLPLLDQCWIIPVHIWILKIKSVGLFNQQEWCCTCRI